MIPRRQFLSAALIGLTAKAERAIPGGFVNDSFPLGHRLRDHANFQRAPRTEKHPIVIVGGGIAGLSAAWRLQKRNFHDFVLLEMESQPGGNSRWGENEITAYPWAAHYVPVPGLRAALVRELLEDLKVLENGVWDERRLCFAPQERLFIHGRWQEGIEPEADSTQRDREEYRRFQDLINEFRATGQFTIPMRLGARESELDRISMQDWLTQNHFTSAYLNWYINYACRDDYGSLARDTSAWAGIHYFASREPDERGPLTWPEGNGWIVRRLLERLQPYIRVNSPVYSIRKEGTRLRVRTESIDYVAEKVIFAAPTFLAPYIIENAPRVDFIYSPWLTANLTIEHPPEDVAWDNVIYDSPTLGYVDATHMSLKTFIDRSVWTFYWSLADRSPAEGRALLLEKDWSYWREAILNDLSRAHPDIRRRVSRIDIMRIGHAMSRPVPGFLKSRLDFENRGPIFYANSDLSGFSIFEEAQYHGAAIADRAIMEL